MNVKHFIVSLLLFSCFAFFLTACEKHNHVTIGIIEPLEHPAMNEIVQGFKDTLPLYYKKPVEIKVENAQNDMNLQRAIIQKMKSADYAMIVPIGMTASQMALNAAPDQPVVSLASLLTDADRKKQTVCHAAIVHDEISSKQLLTFVKKAYPTMRHIMIIHSSSEKVIPALDEAISAGQALGITVSHRMVTTLNELNTVAQSLSNDYDGILILKDHLVVSGASVIAIVAQKKQIPFIASDEGSFEAGADLALGVRERDIGVEGAKLVAAVLNGKNPCDLPVTDMTALTVFVNTTHAATKANLSSIMLAATDLHYKMIKR